jgi:hypothetical protein
MSDFNSRDIPRPQNEEDFQPGATITPEGVSLFATDFRAQALREGILVDVSQTAQEAGFVFPVAVTKNLWEDLNAIPEAYSHEDVIGRLWDVLMVAKLAVRQSSPEGGQVSFRVILHVGKTSAYTVRLICHPGDDLEPVITLSNPDKDFDVDLGRIALTPGALDAFVAAQVSPATYLARHRHGDWGQLDDHDIAANNEAAREGTRIISAYMLPQTEETIWIVTEWDRSRTTLMIPSEY